MKEECKHLLINQNGWTGEVKCSFCNNTLSYFDINKQFTKLFNYETK